MARSRWFDALLTFLCDQPVETVTVTLTLAAIEVLVGQALPASVITRSYWWDRKVGSLHLRLVAIGWQVVQVRREDEDLMITFARVPVDTIG